MNVQVAKERKWQDQQQELMILYLYKSTIT